jgi:hypothetical protein
VLREVATSKIRNLSDAREMDLQLVADEENEDRAKRRKYQTRGMEACAARTRKHVGDCSAKERPDDSEHDCPKDRHVRVHDRFGDRACDQANKDVPDKVKHIFFRCL